MKTIYLITVNGNVSNEAYSTIEEAQTFINSRLNLNPTRWIRAHHTPETGFWDIEQAQDNGLTNRYTIKDVRVK